MANGIMKKDWVSNFTLIGEAVVNDYTFKINQKSEKSSWNYNSMNLGIDCGEEHGTVYCEAMGGYSEDIERPIYAHGKDDNGNDDFDTRIEVAWEDRFDEEILDKIGRMCFFTVGLENTKEGKVFYKNFLSMYDAIDYIHEHLVSGMVVNVRGNLKYSTYNDTTQIRKNITSIVLSSVDDKSKYAARFTQSILIDNESASLSDIDKDKGIMYVKARVLDYVKEYNGVEVKGQFPYRVTFEFPMDFTNKDKCKKVMDKVFKVKKGVTQITMEGEFVEGGATVTATWDDVPEDIKELVDLGIYTKEDAMAKCSSNGSRERRMVLKKPMIKMVGDDIKSQTPVVQKFEERFEESDLILDCMNADDDDAPFDEDTTSNDGDDMDWLNEVM